MRLPAIVVAGLALASLSACGKKHEDKGKEAPKAGAPGSAPGSGVAAPGLKSGPGVDLVGKVIKIGTLNDESGPAVVVGKPFAAGKRLLARRVNAEQLLPDGWKVELVERDHGYNPMAAKKEYDAIESQVLFIGTSFGTANTLPLVKPLERANLVAFPASLSSLLSQNVHTPPTGPTYRAEAMRALDFAVAHAGGGAKVSAGIVYQDDDYGKDGLEGWRLSAAKHGVKIVAEHPIQPTDKDFTAVIKGLQEKGANYVLLSVLPSATGPILGGAAAGKYAPVWLGQTPSWVDAFFAHPNLPAAVFANYYWVMGLPYWGEQIPGMDAFLKAWETHGKDLGKPDFYVLASYTQGLVEIEALRAAIAKGDVSREGYLSSLRAIKGFDAGGLVKPIDLTRFPYEPGLETRVLQPDFAGKTWKAAEHGAWASPAVLSEGAAKAPADATAPPAGAAPPTK